MLILTFTYVLIIFINQAKCQKKLVEQKDILKITICPVKTLTIEFVEDGKEGSKEGSEEIVMYCSPEFINDMGVANAKQDNITVIQNQSTTERQFRISSF
ncbi:hypothetical protein BDAP_002466 [Binucleata daphniae]